MPTKGNVRRITSTIPYNKNDEAVLRKNTRARKSGRFRKRFSAKLRFALVFRSAFLVCVTACACLAERSDATCHRQAHAVVANWTFKQNDKFIYIDYFSPI